MNRVFDILSKTPHKTLKLRDWELRRKMSFAAKLYSVALPVL